METDMRLILLLAALLLPPTRAAGAAPQTFPSSAGDLAVETIAGGLMHPWSLAFLPDGDDLDRKISGGGGECLRRRPCGARRQQQQRRQQ